MRRPPATIPSLPLLPDRYRPVRELGRGGMGIVMLVKDRELDREAALKLILPGKAGPKALARFMREAAITAQLAHPSIMPVYDAGRTDDGSYFMVLKFIEGEGLDARLARHLKGEPWSLGEKLQILQRLCEAAGYMHSRGFVHRDIKPANVMLGKHGEVILADLGLARRFEQDDEEPGSMVDEAELLALMEQLAGRTMDGSVIGTPTYMPPEQAKGAGREIGPPTDVWALGGVLYALLTGEPPYPVRDPLAALKLARAGRVEPVAARLRRLGRDPVSRELSSVLARALDPQAARRYANGLQLGDELGRLVAREPVKAHRYGPGEKLSLFVQRRPGLAAAGAAGLLFAATISAVSAFALQGIAGAEAERAREAERAAAAELARQAAESTASREAMQRAFQEGRVDDLEQQLGVAVTYKRADALNGLAAKVNRGVDDGTLPDILASIPSREIEDYITAFRQAEVYEQQSNQLLLGPDDYIVLSLLYSGALKSPQRAVAPAKEAIRRGDTRPMTKSLLGCLMFISGERNEGFKLVREAAISTDGSRQPKTWINLAKVSIDSGRLDDARDALRRALALDPPQPARDEIAWLQQQIDSSGR